MHNTRVFGSVSEAFLLSLAACGGPAAGPGVASPHVEPVAESGAASGPLPEVSQELGSINEDAVDKNFDSLNDKMQACVTTGMKRVEYLGGEVAVFLRIGVEGHVIYNYFRSSALGDRETEKCLLNVLSLADWPKPQGGEAEVRKTFSFDPPSDVRAPTAWNSDKIAAVLGAAQADIAKCKAGETGNFKGAAYIQPDGKHGKVQAVGMGTPSKEGADKIDCLVGVVQGLQFPTPGSYAAKVSFAL